MPAFLTDSHATVQSALQMSMLLVLQERSQGFALPIFVLAGAAFVVAALALAFKEAESVHGTESERRKLTLSEPD